MTQSTLKKRIHEALDNTKDEEILQVVYTILKRTAIEEEPSHLTAAQKKEIDRRWEDHKSGKSKSYTIDEASKYVRSRLKK